MPIGVQNNKCLIIGALAALSAISLVWLAERNRVVTRTDRTAAAGEEWFERGYLWQLLDNSDHRVSKRRLGLADELWVWAAKDKISNYRLVIDEATVLTQIDTDSDGKIDLIIVRLADGRRCKIAGLKDGSQNAKITWEK